MECALSGYEWGSYGRRVKKIIEKIYSIVFLEIFCKEISLYLERERETCSEMCDGINE